MKFLKRITGQLSPGKEEAVDVVDIGGVLYQVGQEVTLALADVQVDNSLNPREGALDQGLVLRYAEILDQLPAMTAFYLDGGLVLVGGFHRYAAHELEQQATGRFIIAGKGDRDEAQERADFDNLRHGQRMTRKEERAAYARHVRRHPAHSDVWLARELGTTDKTIRSVREELEDASEITKLDKLVGSDGIWRPRSVDRPQKPDPDEEARKLTSPLLPLTPPEEAIERAAAEERDGAVTWKDLGTDGAWRDGRGAKAIRPPGWAALGVDGKWYNRGPDGKPDEDAPIRKGAFAAPPWYLEMFSLAVPATKDQQGAPPAWQQFIATPPLAPVVEAEGGQAASEQANSEPGAAAVEDEDYPEWLKEDEAEVEDVELDQEVAELEVSMPAPVVEPRLASTKPASPPTPPPPPPAPTLPPPPPPVIGRATLRISLSVYPNGNALIDAMEGEKMLLAGGIDPAGAREKVGELIEKYLSEESLSKEEPVNDNAVQV